MASFEYKAKTAEGVDVAAEISADTEAQAFDMLDRMGLFPVEVREKRGPTGGFSLNLSRLTLSRISREHVVAFSRQLADLLKVGITINKALATLAAETSNRDFARIITQIKADVSSGTRVSEAIEKFPRLFNPLYVNMVRAGETGGFLEDVLERIAQFLEQEEELKARVKAAMAYPTLLSVLATGTVIFLMVYFIPQFSKMFTELGGALPAPTRVVMAISEFAVKYGIYVLVGSVIGVFLVIRALGTESGRTIYDSIKIRVPVIGPVFLRTAVSRFARILGTLLKSGVPILQALDITKKAVGNNVFANEIDKAGVSVKEGRPLAEPLKSGRVFPDMVIGMIAVGEESGNLEEVLIQISENYDKQVDRAVRTLVSLMEPAMLVVMGGIVGFVVIAMILPIFSLQGLVK